MGNKEDKQAYKKETEQLLFESRVEVQLRLVELGLIFIDLPRLNAVLLWLERVMPLLGDESIAAEFPAEAVAQVFRYHEFAQAPRPDVAAFTGNKYALGRAVVGYAVAYLSRPPEAPHRPDLPQDVAAFAARWRALPN